MGKITKEYKKNVKLKNLIKDLIFFFLGTRNILRYFADNNNCKEAFIKQVLPKLSKPINKLLSFVIIGFSSVWR